jgi:type III pantothenate kinase
MLLVDVGNSAATVATWTPPDAGGEDLPDPADLAPFRHVALPLPDDDGGRRALATEILSWRQRLDLTAVSVASVVPAVGDALREALPGAWFVDHRARFPFDLAVSDPAAVGADRYCNAAAAAAHRWSSALVVDAGTATTFDMLDGGAFVGGLIAPGLGLAAEALGRRAARLEPVPPEPAPPRPAPDTAAAMAAGAYLTGVYGIAGTIAALLEACGARPVVLTGGLAPLLLADATALPGRAAWRHDPLWTLKGLAALAAFNRV